MQILGKYMMIGYLDPSGIGLESKGMHPYMWGGSRNKRSLLRGFNNQDDEVME